MREGSSAGGPRATSPITVSRAALDDRRVGETTQVGLFLTPGFALMSYASIVEPFRAANALCGRELYRWRNVSIDGHPVQASSGATLLADQSADDTQQCETIFVFAGGEPTQFCDDRTFAWLRRLGRTDVRLAGVSGGPFLLARAGLLQGYSATIHWEHQSAFREAFPSIDLVSGLYVIDRRRLTCAGGTAALDLAIELIERDHGHELASRVSEWFIRTEVRDARRSQRTTLRERTGVANNHVLKALAIMEGSLEEPVSSKALAAMVNVSPRHLERLFALHLKATVGGTYLSLRLTRAMALLNTTSETITSVAMATGFQSLGHFSRVFKARFGRTPRAERHRRIRELSP